MTRQPASGRVLSAPLQPPSAVSKQLLPWLVAVAFFMESLDTTILNTAVPVVSRALNVTVLSMKSVLASYTLSLAVFIPVIGSFVTRLGIGGVPFLLPLLYQVGLGFTPVQSGLLIMPQAIAAMSTKFLMPRILDRIGYRGVLISNTIVLGLLLMLFATIGSGTPFWAIVLQAFCFGAFTSLQYTSMNSLVYADIDEDTTSNASSIASTLQQMSISFGVAVAGLATAFFIPDRFHSNSVELIHGIHDTFLVLGAFTVLSTVIFHKLKSEDGSNVSQHKDLHVAR
jgi:MFS family permease